jgi:hypothetical protein
MCILRLHEIGNVEFRRLRRAASDEHEDLEDIKSWGIREKEGQAKEERA